MASVSGFRMSSFLFSARQATNLVRPLFLSIDFLREVPVTCYAITALSRNYHSKPDIKTTVNRATWLKRSLQMKDMSRSCFQQTLSYSTQATEKGTQSLDDDDVLYSLITVKVKGSDQTVLDSYVQFVTRAAKVLNLDISGRILLPIKIERHTLLKSPHIYKKHRVQYEIRTYGRMLQLRNLTGQTSDVFLEYIQRNLPEGVSMSVEQTALETMPDYLEIPPEAKAFLAQQENSDSISNTPSAASP